MSRGVNKVILIGNLGQDPDTRFTAQGSAVTNLNLATDESYKDKTTGQMVPKTEWHRIVFFNRLAEVAKEYLRKGAKIYVEGKLQTRKWQDQSGIERYTTEIVGTELQMLSRKQGDSPLQPGEQSYQAMPGNGYGGHSGTPTPAQAKPSPMANNPAGHAQNQAASYAAQTDDFDDDIPF